jgi:hypothetical protein
MASSRDLVAFVKDLEAPAKYSGRDPDLDPADVEGFWLSTCISLQLAEAPAKYSGRDLGLGPADVLEGFWLSTCI